MYEHLTDKELAEKLKDVQKRLNGASGAYYQGLLVAYWELQDAIEARTIPEIQTGVIIDTSIVPEKK